MCCAVEVQTAHETDTMISQYNFRITFMPAGGIAAILPEGTLTSFTVCEAYRYFVDQA